MLDLAMSWIIANPLQSVVLMACGSVIAGLALIPRLHAYSSDGHPRC